MQTCECGADVFIKKTGQCRNCYNREYYRRNAERIDRKRILRKEEGAQCLIDVGYEGAHARLRESRGQARDYQCVWCNRPALDWALKRGGVREVTGTRTHSSGVIVATWSTNPLDYQPMCRSCHRRMDTGTTDYTPYRKNWKVAAERAARRLHAVHDGSRLASW
jgi:hypothetical protein